MSHKGSKSYNKLYNVILIDVGKVEPAGHTLEQTKKLARGKQEITLIPTLFFPVTSERSQNGCVSLLKKNITTYVLDVAETSSGARCRACASITSKY